MHTLTEISLFKETVEGGSDWHILKEPSFKQVKTSFPTSFSAVFREVYAGTQKGSNSFQVSCLSAMTSVFPWELFYCSITLLLCSVLCMTWKPNFEPPNSMMLIQCILHQLTPLGKVPLRCISVGESYDLVNIHRAHSWTKLTYLNVFIVHPWHEWKDLYPIKNVWIYLFLCLLK